MKITELKTLIRATVRECVNEILAERYIERKMNEALKKNELSHPPVIAKEIVTEERKVDPNIRKEIIAKLGLEEANPMASLFEDTLQSNNVLIDGRDQNDMPGQVSESAMQKAGIMKKDWTKYF